MIRPGGATVVEFKTGRPRPEHETQAAWYARAVEAADSADKGGRDSGVALVALAALVAATNPK